MRLIAIEWNQKKRYLNFLCVENLRLLSTFTWRKENENSQIVLGTPSWKCRVLLICAVSLGTVVCIYWPCPGSPAAMAGSSRTRLCSLSQHLLLFLSSVFYFIVCENFKSELVFAILVTSFYGSTIEQDWLLCPIQSVVIPWHSRRKEMGSQGVPVIVMSLHSTKQRNRVKFSIVIFHLLLSCCLQVLKNLQCQTQIHVCRVKPPQYYHFPKKLLSRKITAVSGMLLNVRLCLCCEVFSSYGVPKHLKHSCCLRVIASFTCLK